MVGGRGAATPTPVAELMREHASHREAGIREHVRPRAGIAGEAVVILSDSEVPANRPILDLPRGHFTG
jgi:hypothetical protein